MSTVTRLADAMATWLEADPALAGVPVLRTWMPALDAADLASARIYVRPASAVPQRVSRGASRWRCDLDVIVAARIDPAAEAPCDAVAALADAAALRAAGFASTNPRAAALEAASIVYAEPNYQEQFGVFIVLVRVTVEMDA